MHQLTCTHNFLKLLRSNQNNFRASSCMHEYVTTAFARTRLPYTYDSTTLKVNNSMTECAILTCYCTMLGEASVEIQ